MNIEQGSLPPSPIHIALNLTCALIEAGKISPVATEPKEMVFELMQLVVAAGSKMSMTATRTTK